MKNKLIKEILVIVFVSISIGFLYNAFIPNALPIIPVDKSTLVVKDSDLFANAPAPATQVLPEQAVNAMTREDSLKLAKQKTLDSLKKWRADSIKTIAATKITPELLAQNKNSANQNFKIVTYEQMKRIVNSPGFYIIDARRPDQYASGKIANAVNIFPYDDQPVYAQKLMRVESEKTIVVYCDGGTCDLSHEVAKDLTSIFKSAKVFVYEGGWEEWTKNKGK